MNIRAFANGYFDMEIEAAKAVNRMCGKIGIKRRNFRRRYLTRTNCVRFQWGSAMKCNKQFFHCISNLLIFKLFSKSSPEFVERISHYNHLKHSECFLSYILTR
eukprot:UN05441